jgi:hypothetical protein
MTEDSGQPRQMSDYIHLFLSGSRKRGSGSSIPAEHRIWLIFPEYSPYRGFLSAGISAFISGGGSLVTLVEAGNSLPNAGYYFALEPERYLLPFIGDGDSLNELISPSLRYAFSTGNDSLRQFEERFAEKKLPHFIIHSFGVPSGTGAFPFETIVAGSRCYSLKPEPVSEGPDAVLLADFAPDSDIAGLLERIGETAPGVRIFETGTGSRDTTEDIRPERIEPPGAAGIRPERRAVPVGPEFTSFMNVLLRRISGALAGSGKAEAV